MAKERVSALAKQIGMPSKRLIEWLNSNGEYVKTPSSTVEAVVVAKVFAAFPPIVESDQGGQSRPVARPLPPESRPERSQARRSIRADGTGADRLAMTDFTRPSENPWRRHPETPPPVPLSGSPAAKTPAEDRPKIVSLHSMSSQADVDRVIRGCRDALLRSRPRVVIDLEGAEGFYPSAAVPIASVIQYFRSLGLVIQVVNEPRVAQTMYIRNPLEVTPDNILLNDAPSRLWIYYDHRQTSLLTNAFLDAIRRRVECTDGVLDALDWCLHETLDNVPQHANTDAGFAMLQIHPRAKRLAVGIADTGIGIRRSLSTSVNYKPRSAFDAITMAIREGVTRDKQTNQGNGLFGLERIIEQNGGRLVIRSDRGEMVLQGDRVSGGNGKLVLDAQRPGTFIDFQLDVSKPVSLTEALNYQHANLYLESFENDTGEHVVEIRKYAGGAGTRRAAAELRVFLLNLLNEGAPCLTLDFTGQTVVSSSFADEVIGRLVKQLGFVGFNAKFRLVNMSPTVAGLIDRAITQRMATAEE